MGTSDYTPKQLQRFWSKVDKSGGDDACWLWTGCRRNQRYGHCRWGGKMRSSHRIAWEITNGVIPDGLCVCHHCDNPPCVNPKHLFLGTQLDNVRDYIAKGLDIKTRARGDRHGRRVHPETCPRGESSGKARLTNAKVLEMRRRFANEGVTKTQLSRELGVALSTVHDVITGRTWSHL